MRIENENEKKLATLNWHPTTRAALWMGGALSSFVAMAIAGRQLSSSLGTFQILFFRSLFGLVIICLLLWRSGWRQVITRRVGVHALRNAGHFGGQFGWFYGLGFIPLAEVFAIEFTTPIWTALLAAFLLKERLTFGRLFAIALGLAGVLIIVRPGSGVVHPAALAVLLSAMGYAMAHIMTKKLSATETPLCILFYMTVMQLPLALLLSMSNWTTPVPAMWPLIGIIGTTALTANYCVARAMALADATIIVPMDFLRLPVIAVIGSVFYGEQIQLPVLIGTVLILGGSVLNLYFERKRHQFSATRE
jgi:drug/metabolite transporter (DMT)-like permease